MIRSRYEKLYEFGKTNDLDGFLSMYTDDSLLSMDQTRPILGKEGLALCNPKITTLNLIAVISKVFRRY